MEELKASFQKVGYAKIPPSIFSLDAETVAELKEEFDALFHGRFETGIYPDEIHWRPGISCETATREICNAWKASTKVAKIVCSQRLGLLACQLMGWDSSRIGQDDVLHKPPRSNAVGFHQDGAYISDNFLPRENNSLTMWIALDDADEENGCLQYASGSHLWSASDSSAVPARAPIASNVLGSTFHVGRNDDHLATLMDAAAQLGKNGHQVMEALHTVSVKAGQMVVHHQDVWHGSRPNASDTRHRRALVAHLIDGKVRWREEPKPHYIYGRYFLRGESHPRDDFFPVTASQDNSVMERSSWLDQEM